MKRVALFSDGWKRLITYAWVDGMLRYISGSEEDICLYQYNSQGNWSLDEKHNHGEYNIYTLPDLSYFDGIIMDCTNILERQYLDCLVDRIRKADKPTVSIGSYIDGFFYAGVDNKRSITDIMDHLYTKHGCKSYVFVGGPKENYENTLRVEAYFECLERFGLPREDNPVWYGDYDFSSGVRYFEQYVKEFGDRTIEFPDVFVCANDNIASGLCYQAQQYGYHIPGDFKVTGFDSLDKAICFEPQITTVGHMRENIGQQTMEIFADVWAGKEVQKKHFMRSKCIFTESCGCPNSGLLNYRAFAKKEIISKVEELQSEELLIKFESDIVKCESFEGVFQRIAAFFMQLECDGFAIVVDKRLLEGEDDSAFCIDGYDKEHLVVAYASEGKQLLDIKDVNELLKYYDRCGAGSAYMFSPIHFREKTVGYSILENGKFLYDKTYFYDIHNVITRTLESLYKNLQLKNVNKKLRHIYNRDQLTGLYNRIAYTEMIEPEYYRYRADNKKCVLAFVDADNFKQINDVYGHEKGDMILKKIASVLLEQCPKGGYVYRYGGDEFIAFFPVEEDAAAQAFKTEAEAMLEKVDISVSIGFVVTDPASDKIFDDYLRMADKDMYRVKAERKQTKINNG